MPFQMAVPAALAGDATPVEVAALGRESLLGAMSDAEAMPEFHVAYMPCTDLLGILTPENAQVLTPMAEFRRLMRSSP